jgi:hypothetical protein
LKREDEKEKVDKEDEEKRMRKGNDAKKNTKKYKYREIRKRGVKG